jgi:hypothetical protein
MGRWAIMKLQLLKRDILKLTQKYTIASMTTKVAIMTHITQVSIR